MRNHTPLLLVLSAISVLSADTAPFENTSPNLHSLNLFKRASCASGSVSCSSISAPNECCPSSTVCGRDANNNVACCPIGKVCTGVVSAGAARPSTTSSGFVFGATTTTTSPTSYVGYSTVPNQYYPFVAIPTSYTNQAACLQAYTTCQAASTSCYASLATNNGLGVTISGVSGIITSQQIPTGTYPAAVASSICNSLSQAGCYGIQSTQCAAFGTAGQSSTGNFVQANYAPRCTGAAYAAAAAGLGIGMAVL